LEHLNSFFYLTFKAFPIRPFITSVCKIFNFQTPFFPVGFAHQTSQRDACTELREKYIFEFLIPTGFHTHITHGFLKKKQFFIVVSRKILSSRNTAVFFQ